MKKRLGLLALATVLSSATYAASIDHIQTYTPEYLGNQAQNGMINKSSAYYNPAGLVHLENGTYVQLGGQLALGHEKMTYGGKEYKAQLVQPIPNFALYKVEDDSALYWTFGALGGGGDLKYKDGVAGTAVIPDILAGIGLVGFSTNESKVEGSNLYIQNTLGKVFKVDEKLSLSVAGRAIYGSRTLKGDIYLNGKVPKLEGGQVVGMESVNETASMDSKRTAWGFGGQLGLNYKASDRLNLAMRYDTRVKLNFKAHGSEQGLNSKNPIVGSLNGLGFGAFYPEYSIGTKSRRDLPAILAAGMSYRVTDDWTVALSGNYYFNKDAKMDSGVKKGSSKLETLKVKEIHPEYDNGWELALGTEYRLSPKWAVLGSINYADTGAKVTSYDDVEYGLNSVMLGTGLKYNPDDTTEWVFTVTHFIYDSQDGHYNQKYSNPIFKDVKNPEYSKSITAMGVSYTKRF
ncbi:OmpP1/FadL family transporter [Fusobacterium sp.]|uniref:OmpP1/FadL family transporter n=1 Tax=Fusobacterium sp. TaxID=68766 RepID=UPI0025C45782|nr:outer membrane protein transport protein [Fusobacterium sp.]